LTKEAENALLKTLEEPPPHIIFILATTAPHDVQPTIISRCQRFDFRRLTMAAVVAGLQRICGGEGIELDEAALQEVARSAGGSLRDAINLVEQLTSYYGPSPTLEQVRDSLGLTADARTRELVKHILAKDLSAGLKLIAAVRDDGVDMRHFQRELVDYLRFLLVVKAGAEETLDLGAEEINEMRSLAEGAAAEDVTRALRGFGQADFRDDSQSSLPLELALAEHVLGPVTPQAPGPAAPEPETPPRSRFAGPQPSAGRPPFRPAGPTFGPDRSAPGAGAGRPGDIRPGPTGVGQVRSPAGQVGPRPIGPDRPRPAMPRPDPAVEPGLRARLQEETTPDATAAEPSEGTPAPVEGPAGGSVGPQQGDDFLRRLRRACNEFDSPPHRVGAYLNGTCEVQSMDNGVLVLAFYQQFSLHKGKTEQPAHKRIIEQAASKIAGQAVTLECTLSGQARPAGPAKSGGHLVQAARQMGARPVIGGKGGPSGAARNEP
jgi:DNA polymerase-3 subunit gamma/tau